jgi:hypothetical protein
VASRGLPVTGSVAEFRIVSARARRIRSRAISASLASTLPSRSMSHFRISSSRDAAGACAAAEGDSIACVMHQAITSPQAWHPRTARFTRLARQRLVFMNDIS